MPNQLSCFLVILIVSFCAPLKDSYRSEITLNFEDEGFIDPDIFQVICEIPMGNKLKKDLNRQLENRCRKRFLEELIQFHYQYRDSREISKSEYSGENQYEVDLEATKALIKIYPEASEAKVLYRSSDGNLFKGVMRLERRGLYQIIASRPYSLKEENISK